MIKLPFCIENVREYQVFVVVEVILIQLSRVEDSANRHIKPIKIKVINI